METSYKLLQCPSREDLLRAIDSKSTLHFYGLDKSNRYHQFEVFVTGIDLIDMGQNDGTCKVRGIIVTKDGQQLNPTGRYQASYNSRRHEGEFEEIAGAEDYSLEYFRRMDDKQLALEIKENRDRMPKEVRELEQFANGLSNHERLALLALHTHLLSDACIVPKVHHQLAATVKKIRAERANKPVFA
jgi:hypothetical protein